jgi:hypothetical protein
MPTHAQWKTLDLSELQRRLTEVKLLLEQAAALAAAQDANRLASMTELQQRQAEERHGNPQRQRYR